MTIEVRRLKEIIDRFPRVPLAALPTPLEKCPRLSQALGAWIAIKRDDLTGLAFGGNKTRQLEFILARALERGCDSVITMAALQSNQCRQTAAAARKIGLPVYLVLRGDEPEVPDANLLLDRLLGANLHVLPSSAKAEEMNAAVAALAAELRIQGRRPYTVDLMNDASPDQEWAAVAYTGMVVELIEQSGGVEQAPHWIYLSSGSGGSATQAGTWLGCRALGLPTRVVGVTAAHTRERVCDDTLEIARRAAGILGLSLSLLEDVETMSVERGFVGEGYGHATEEGLEAMRLAARAEGLILDPVYTGKALAAMRSHIQEGRVAAGDSVIFVHTGGTPLTFLQYMGRRIVGGKQ